MTDLKHCMCGCIYEEAHCPNCNKVTDKDRIEALTEQLAAAQQDAKEAEAYAEELEQELGTCRMAQAVMDNTVADLEAKLVEALRNLLVASDTGRGFNTARNEARTTLAEIKGESHE